MLYISPNLYFYREKTEESLAATEEFVSGVQKLNSNLVKPTITPRFALSCTKELLKALGDLAKSHNLHVQVKKKVRDVKVVLINIQKIFLKFFLEPY